MTGYVLACRAGAGAGMLLLSRRSIHCRADCVAGKRCRGATSAIRRVAERRPARDEWGGRIQLLNSSCVSDDVRRGPPSSLRLGDAVAAALRHLGLDRQRLLASWH
eukprot:scaffold3504_cov240-Pinguiococcus_pyrenoidosus.AAC.73